MTNGICLFMNFAMDPKSGRYRNVKRFYHDFVLRDVDETDITRARLSNDHPFYSF